MAEITKSQPDGTTLAGDGSESSEVTHESLEIPHELLSKHDLEVNKGFFAPPVVIYEDERGQKHLYALDYFQRLYLTVEDPNLSYIGRTIGVLMMAVIVLSCLFYVISSLDSFKVPDDNCVAPICKNNDKLCPNKVVCEPISISYMDTVELLCVVIFTVEYGIRILLVWCMPPRLIGISMQDVEKEGQSFDQTKETPDTLLLEQLKFLRRHLDAHDDAENKDKKQIEEIDKNDELLPRIQKPKLTGILSRASIKGSIKSADKTVDPVETAKQQDSAFQSWVEWETKRWNLFAKKSDPCQSYSGAYKTLLYGIKMLNIIDLLAVLPFYVELFISAGASVTVIRVLRLARVFRVFKMGKNSKGVDMLAKTFYNSLPALSLLAFFIALGVILFGAVIFFLEQGTFTVNEDYPHGAYVRKNLIGVDEVSPYNNILTSSYWAVVVSTTVGYGDLTPTSTAGLCIACLCAYYGVLLLALPITVIGSNFSKLYDSSNGKDDEVLVLDCLDGISKTVHFECYRAEQASHCGLDSINGTTQSCIYGKIMGIISTFDATKQSLLKDSISKANDRSNRDKLQKNIDQIKEIYSQKVETAQALDGSRACDSTNNDEQSVLSQPEIETRHVGKQHSPHSTPPPGSRKKIGNNSFPPDSSAQAHVMQHAKFAQLNLKPSECVDLLLAKKKSKIRELDVNASMPAEPEELHLPMKQLGLPRSMYMDTFDKAQLTLQLEQLRGIISQLPMSDTAPED